MRPSLWNLPRARLSLAGRVPTAKPAREAIHRDRSPLLPLARLCRTIARQRTPCQPFCLAAARLFLLFSCEQLDISRWRLEMSRWKFFAPSRRYRGIILAMIIAVCGELNVYYLGK